VEVVSIETPGLGDRSYLVHDGEVGLVIDPQRDIDRTLGAAEAAGVRIAGVAETHLHNDYVSGGLELSRQLGVPYLVAAAEEVSYQREPVAGGDEREIGSLHVQVFATPGHTPHHVSYLVSDLVSGAGRQALFSGGSLLYGTVGRTDLVGTAQTEPLTRAQYRSARMLAGLPGETEVWPTHGFGSFCSSAKSSGAATSSIAAERAGNLALTIDDEDTFVARLLDGLTAYPRYYAHMAPINRAGPPAIDLRPPQVLGPEDLAAFLASPGWVIDLAGRRAYAQGHLHGSVSMELRDSFATYLGWILPWGSSIALVGDTPEQVAQAQLALARIGIDHLRGMATGPRSVLAAGVPLASYRVSDFSGLAEAWGAGSSIVVLDVRRDDERVLGGIEGSLHVPLPDLLARLDDLPAGEVWVHCATGFRASIAASLLARAGRDVVLMDDEWPQAAVVGLSVEVPGSPVPAGRSGR
jgi:hydroxyacylglutathione hydrolase